MHPIECNKTGFATNLQVPTFRTNPLESKSSPTDAATFGCRPLLQGAAWTDFWSVRRPAIYWQMTEALTAKFT